MEVTDRVYLVWTPQGWSAFTELSCPDLNGAFASYMFRSYEIPRAKFQNAIKKLGDAARDLNRREIIASKDNEGETFPELSYLLN